MGAVRELVFELVEERDGLLEALQECCTALGVLCPAGTGTGCYALHHARRAIQRYGDPRCVDCGNTSDYRLRCDRCEDCQPTARDFEAAREDMEYDAKH